MLMSPDAFARSLTDAADHIERVAGSRSCPAFRPHAGWRSWAMYAGLKRIDHQLVGWAGLLWDWNWFRARTADSVMNRLRDRVKDGDIIVMHDGDESAPFEDQRHTVDATARLIPDCALGASASGSCARTRRVPDESQDESQRESGIPNPNP